MAAPLSSLPSCPGPHVQAIQALGDDSWLLLGEPAADPTWGKALARGYHNRMAYAPDLKGAFFYGEGEHGEWNLTTRLYGDDCWFYDLQAHRWICLYPGTNVDTFGTAADPITVDGNGWEVDASGQPIPCAPMVHGYELSAYLPDRKKLMFLAIGGGYWTNTPLVRRLAWLPDGGKSVKGDPFYYDVETGRWEREKATGLSMPGLVGTTSSLTYLYGMNKTWHYRRRKEGHLYDNATHVWSKALTTGTPPAGLDAEGLSSYDSERNWVFLANPKDPVLPYIYDAGANAWVNPQPQNAPPNTGPTAGGGVVYPGSQHSTLTYDSVNDVLLMVHHRYPQAGNNLVGLGYYVYDVQTAEWSAPAQIPAEFLKQYRRINAFYDPQLNVHVFHVGEPKRTDGVIWVYRHKRNI